MMLQRALFVLLLVSCKESSDDQALKDEKAALQQQLAVERAKNEAAANQGLTTSPEEITKLREDNMLKEAQLALAAQKSEELALLYKSSMTPYAGIWVLDPQPDLGFEGCYSFVRLDADSGAIYRATVCSDGKLQAELQTVAGFSAKNDAGWAGTLGFSMEALSKASSCGSQASLIGSGTQYGFDHSVGTATAGYEAALFMTSSLGDKAANFQSGSLSPDLGKNKNCPGIIARSQFESQASNALLQAAARVCQLDSTLLEAGCFTEPGIFLTNP